MYHEEDMERKKIIDYNLNYRKNNFFNVKIIIRSFFNEMSRPCLLLSALNGIYFMKLSSRFLKHLNPHPEYDVLA